MADSLFSSGTLAIASGSSTLRTAFLTILLACSGVISDVSLKLPVKTRIKVSTTSSLGLCFGRVGGGTAGGVDVATGRAGGATLVTPGVCMNGD